jgi:hypothetical protein
VLQDLQDGTWALGEGAGAGAGGRWACLGSGGSGMAASAAAPGAACTRFWLYGTPLGSYALLSAGAGQFVAAAAGDPAAPLGAGGLDPRTTPSDGARFFLEEGV